MINSLLTPAGCRSRRKTEVGSRYFAISGRSVNIAAMPRFMIVRLFDVTEPEMPDVGRRSRELVETEFEQITWEHSHVVVDDDGSVRTYCVYEAPTADMVVEHSPRLWQARGRLDRGDRGRRHACGLPARLTSPRWNDAWAAIARRRRMKLLRSSSPSGTSSSACR